VIENDEYRIDVLTRSPRHQGARVWGRLLIEDEDVTAVSGAAVRISVGIGHHQV